MQQRRERKKKAAAVGLSLANDIPGYIGDETVDDLVRYIEPKSSINTYKKGVKRNKRLEKSTAELFVDTIYCPSVTENSIGIYMIYTSYHILHIWVNNLVLMMWIFVAIHFMSIINLLTVDPTVKIYSKLLCIIWRSIWKNDC